MLIALVTVLRLWLKNKNNAYIWLVAHLVVFSFAVVIWIKAITGSTLLSGTSMSSENTSLYIGQAGIVWTVSIIFLLNAIEVLLDSGWILYVVLAVMVVTITYAIVSSILIETKKK